MLALASINAKAQLVTVLAPDSTELFQLRLNNPDATTLTETFGPVAEYPRPAIYDKWFVRIAKCEGLELPPQAEIDKLRFFVVNSDQFQNPADSSVAFDAVTFNRPHIIIIVLPHVWNYAVVAHEFLHFVLWYNFGDKYEHYPNTHPVKYFGHCSIRPN